MSSTLDRVDWNAELVRGDLTSAVQQLKREYVADHIFNYKRKADAEVFLNALRQTGLPE